MTKSGKMILIASVIIDDEHVDESQTLFDDYEQDEVKAEEEDISTDDHSCYETS